MEMPSLELIVIKDAMIFYAKTFILKGNKKSSGTEGIFASAIFTNDL